jgi:hypothetical protein
VQRHERCGSIRRPETDVRPVTQASTQQIAANVSYEFRQTSNRLIRGLYLVVNREPNPNGWIAGGIFAEIHIESTDIGRQRPFPENSTNKLLFSIEFFRLDHVGLISPERLTAICSV